MTATRVLVIVLCTIMIFSLGILILSSSLSLT